MLDKEQKDQSIVTQLPEVCADDGEPVTIFCKFVCSLVSSPNLTDDLLIGIGLGDASYDYTREALAVRWLESVIGYIK